jgi:curli biogenesis system outer membrane secretion channel CsgG
MNPQRIITAVLCVFLCGQARAQAQDMDKELSDMAGKLATLINGQGKKKVAVLDFTDLQGGSSELGKYIAEQLTVNLVMGKRDFSVLDRANLKSILAEHKLTATGLVDPENAKKLGMFAGVDALILGTIIPKNQNISLTAKIITTDTAEIVGAAKGEFKLDSTVQQLLSHPLTESTPTDNAASSANGTPQIVKTFGALRVEVRSLRIVNGTEYLLDVSLINLSSNIVAWMALNANAFVLGSPLKSTVSDPEGYEFTAGQSDVSGIGVTDIGAFGRLTGDPTQIRPGESIPATIKFSSRPGRVATAGRCRLQLNILAFSRDGYGHFQSHAERTVVGEITTN